MISILMHSVLSIKNNFLFNYQLNTFNDIWYIISTSLYTALHLAVKKENIQIINLLLKYKGIDINTWKYTNH